MKLDDAVEKILGKLIDILLAVGEKIIFILTGD